MLLFILSIASTHICPEECSAGMFNGRANTTGIVGGIAFVIIFHSVFFLFLARNIFRRKVAEAALRVSEENLKTTLDSIGDAVIATDLKGRVTRMNPVAEKLTGFSMDTATGKTLNNLVTLLNIKKKDQIVNPAMDVISMGMVKGFETHHLLTNKYGEEYRITCSGSPIKKGPYKTIGAVLVFRDITEIYQIEEKLKQKQNLDSLGLLAGGVAHDFNNLLTGIIGNSELLLKRLKDETLISYSKSILKISRNAVDITQKLLSFSRKRKMVSKELDMHGAIEDTLELFRHGIDKRIQLETELNAKFPVVSGDPSQVRNMILNLGVNSRDAMPNGGRLSISTENVYLDELYCKYSSFDLEPGDYIRLCVEDTGAGMSHEVIKHIFEPFYTTKMIGKGTGLGLAVVYGTVKDHAGAIDVESTPGVKTRFVIHLPVNNQQARKYQLPQMAEIDMESSV